MVAAVVASVLALSGGFGFGRFPLIERLAYWLGVLLIGALLGRFVSTFCLPRPWFAARPIRAAVLMTFLIGLPMTVVSAASVAWMKRLEFDASLLLEVLPAALLVTAGIVILAFLVRDREAVETHQAPAGAPPARFLARLPERLAGADLWAVQAEDHYLRLRTSRGEDLVLMRLADALVELEGIEGARTHRSWWVARGAVSGVERGEGRATLILPDGARAPVSRSYLKPLKEAGWF